MRYELKKGRKERKTVNVPLEMYEMVKKIVENGKLGYVSADDFIRDAIRKRLRELGYNI